MTEAVRARIWRRAIEALFLIGLGLALFAPGIPYRSYTPAVLPFIAWLICDRAWCLRRERSRVRSLRAPYVLIVDLERL